MNSKNDTKKNILITGSTSGLGYFLAEIFNNDNFNVFINGSSRNKLDIAKKKLGVDGYACDVTKPTECRKLISNCKKALGSIDLIVCNVGSGSSVNIGEETLEEWKRVLILIYFLLLIL